MQQALQRSIDFLRRQVQAEDFCCVMALAVGQQAQDLLTAVTLSLTGDKLPVVGQADVTLVAVVARRLAKILEQQAGAAGVGALGIVQHGLDAQAVLLLTVFVDLTRQADVLWVFAAL